MHKTESITLNPDEYNKLLDLLSGVRMNITILEQCFSGTPAAIAQTKNWLTKIDNILKGED